MDPNFLYYVASKAHRTPRVTALAASVGSKDSMYGSHVHITRPLVFLYHKYT